MTFRIDSARLRQRTDGACWYFEIKGYQGKGIYVDLMTDDDGRGLWVQTEFEGTFEQLLSVDDFEIPLEATPKSAREKLALALYEFGWGPRVCD